MRRGTRRESCQPSNRQTSLSGRSAAPGCGPCGLVAADILRVERPFTLRRRGVEAKLVVGATRPNPDPVLRRKRRDAHRWTAALTSGTPIDASASEAGHHDPHIRTRAQLSFLSPRLQAAIVEGTLRPDIALKRILKTQIPLDWAAQERLFRM